MITYDIVGDVHGCADKLEGLLKQLGYRESDHAFRQSNHQAIFVGDLIDRGDKQKETLRLVRAMQEAGAAQVIMGNHEFNAISFSTPNPEIPGEFMRPHNDKNRKQHEECLAQLQMEPGLYRESIEWFRTLPLWVELGDKARVVHACWHQASIQAVADQVAPLTRMSDEFVEQANHRGTQEYEAIEILLKGPELNLKKFHQPSFEDKDGHERSHARIRWWNDKASTLDALAEIPGNATMKGGAPYPGLPDLPCSEGAEFDYRDPQLVFYGHYWRTGAPVKGTDWTTKTACVDFSAVKGGPLVAYRWEGENEIMAERFHAYP
jgi:hypothetical protein